MTTALRKMFRKLKFGDPIVIVSGLPRSGTSMAMKMLEAGGMDIVADGIRQADEDNPKGYFEDERVKNLDKGGDTSWLKTTRGRSIKIIASLIPYLPETNNYKIIFMQRNIHEVLASQSKMLERRGETNETSDERMIELYREHVEKVKFLLRFRPYFEALEVHYKDVLDDPRAQAQRMRDFLGRPLDIDKMVAVVDERLYRNRRE